MAIDFGRDTSCTTSMRTGRFVSGVRSVAEAAYRRLTTPRGMLLGGEDERNYGLDLTELIGSVSTTDDEASLPGRIQSELTKDERIQSVDVRLGRSVLAGRITYAITIEARTSEGPFELQLRASAVTVDLLRILPEAA